MTFHRGVTGFVIQVLHALHGLDTDTFFHQVFVDVQQPAIRKYGFEFVLLQLIHAGAAGDDNGADIHVVQGIGETMKQHPVFSADSLAFGLVPG